MIELEERIATAAEKAPTDDVQIQALRAAIARVKAEYDSVVDQEEERAGGRWPARDRNGAPRIPPG